VYRDPLDDEAELREIVGDEPVDALLDADLPGDARDPLLAALDVLRVLQGWASDEAAGRWLTSPAKRLGGRTPLQALAAGAVEDVEDAARAYAAALG
jgi:hypothetical protein